MNTPSESPATSSAVRELIAIAVASVLLFVVAGQLDLLEKLISFLHDHEEWELDEIISTSVFLLLCMAVYSARRWREAKDSERRSARINAELEKSMAEVKQLRGIIPICASCKKIRSDAGSWERLEAYISSHSEAQFSHGVCPDCAKKLYPDVVGPDRDVQ